jgi:hypothetical protein
MNRAARVLSIIPAVAGLGWLSAYAVEQGFAGTVAFETAVTTSPWSVARTPAPMGQVLDGLRNDLVRARDAAPSDPAIHDLLGIIAAHSVDRAEYASEADVHFVKAIELRPTSPYTWASLAGVRYLRGDTGAVFDAALENSVKLGPNEADVQRTVSNLGLAVWNEKSATTQAAIEAAVAAGMRRNSLEMLQIADKRGRLPVACRHLAGSTRQTDSKAVQLCQSMEVTP